MGGEGEWDGKRNSILFFFCQYRCGNVVKKLSLINLVMYNYDFERRLEKEEADLQ